MDYNSENQPTYSMKWHKFLIYFALWASAVANVYNAARLLTGSVYGSSTDAARVYMYFSGMKTVDTVFGVIFILAAVYAIYARFQLAGLKTGAPSKLLLVYAFNIGLSLIYAVVTSSVTGLSLGDMMDSNTVTSVVVGIAMIFANKKYYDNRASLFVN